jgi:hydrocephalus-inducing protein
LKFEATHDLEERCEVIEKQIELANTTTLPIHITIICPLPFKLKHNIKETCLQPEKTLVVVVCLDPDYSESRISSEEHAKLTIVYNEHAQKDHVDLFSVVNFPNLSFSSNYIKFGCISTDMEQRKIFQIKNISKIPVSYQWYFIEEKNTNRSEISQIFDVQPLCGYLEPDDYQDVEVYFYGQSQVSLHRKILCDVKGGPKYDLELQGEASNLIWTFEKTVIDFGSHPFTSQLSQEIILTNTGQVKFDYCVIIFPNSVLSDKVVISPAKGIVKPRESLKINGD